MKYAIIASLILAAFIIARLNKKRQFMAVFCALAVACSSQAAWAADAGSLHNPNIEPDADMIAQQNTTWDTIYFGYYPQHEIVADPDQCGTITNKIWASENDYSVDPEVYEKLENAEYTAQGDTVIDGVKYRRLSKSDRTFVAAPQDINNHYFWKPKYEYHYFRYEPIKWRVLNAQSGESGNRALLLADKVLDDKKYNKDQTTVTWENSDVRSWLNGYGTENNFINTAFGDSEVSSIVESSLTNNGNYEYGVNGGNSTKDKIFLLSEDEVYLTPEASSFGFVSAAGSKVAVEKVRDIQDEAKRAQGTTYSKALGVWCNHEDGFEGNNMWWMRSPGEFDKWAAFVCNRGFIRYYGFAVDKGDVGIRPAMVLNLDAAGWKPAGTVSSNGAVSELPAPDLDVFGKNDPDSGETPGKPEQPEKPEQPDGTETPGKPEQPDGSETPGTPDNPGGAGGSGGSSAPDNPGGTGGSGGSSAPSTPSTPNVPETPEKPDKPGAPETPDTPDKPDDVKVSQIHIASKTSFDIAAGKKVTLLAVVVPFDATYQSVSWHSSNEKYATVDSSGVVTTKPAGRGKTVIFTAKAEDGSDVACSVKLHIKKHSVKSVSLKGPGTIKRGKSAKLKATVKTTGKDANRTLKYTTSSRYVKVSASRKITVQKKIKKNSTVKITAMTQDGTNRKAYIRIKIK